MNENDLLKEKFRLGMIKKMDIDVEDVEQDKSLKSSQIPDLL
jgi:hypothetical protein